MSLLASARPKNASTKLVSGILFLRCVEIMGLKDCEVSGLVTMLLLIIWASIEKFSRNGSLDTMPSATVNDSFVPNEVEGGVVQPFKW